MYLGQTTSKRAAPQRGSEASLLFESDGVVQLWSIGRPIQGPITPSSKSAQMAGSSSWGQPRRLSLAVAWLLLLQALLRSMMGPLADLLGKPASQAPATADLFRPMAELVEPHGFALEEHFVTTADGFILRLFRIPGPRSTSIGATTTPSYANSSSSNNTSGSRPVVFMMHALMDSSAGWLLLGRQSLALQLAAAGFDVWLGNARGNRFSRNHTSSRLQPHEGAFWAFGWDDIAEHDLPASINHALAVSGTRQLVYVGYSQGTMVGLAALSGGELAAAVSLAVLMAPVAFTTAMTSPAFTLSVRLGLDRFALKQGWGEWGSFQQANSDAMMPVCRRWPAACLIYLTTFCGSNPDGNVQPGLVPLVFRHLPAGTSVQVMAQWGQAIRRASTTHLHRFDYGSDCSGSSGVPQQPRLRPACNQIAYGQAEPLSYDLAAITTPIALFTGGRDTISSGADVELLRRRLRPGVLQLHHHEPNYAHLDYELGTDAPYKAYPHVLRLAKQFGFSST